MATFPHSARVRPSQSTSGLVEFWNFGGKRILFLYLALAAMLYWQSARRTTSAKQQAATSGVCKTVHFIRHGEATHNRDARLFEDFYKGRHLSPVYHDAPLTEAGHAQAAELHRVLAAHRRELADADLIVSSTLRRALQTARAAFPHPKPITATDLCRERIASYASDKRRPLSEVRAEFPGVSFEQVHGEHDTAFDHEKEIHPDPYDSNACKERARRFVTWLLKERQEKDIVVVTHWVFLQHLMKAENIENQVQFGNAELRSFMLCRD